MVSRSSERAEQQTDRRRNRTVGPIVAAFPFQREIQAAITIITSPISLLIFCPSIFCRLIHMSSSPITGSAAKSSRPGLFANGRQPSARGPHAASHAAMPVQDRQHLLCLNHSSSSQGAPRPQLRPAFGSDHGPLNSGLALAGEGFHASILVLPRLGNLTARGGLHAIN